MSCLKISPILIYKIFLNIFYYSQTSIYLLYLVLIKNILKTIKISSNPFPKLNFWPVAVDRAVDRLCFRSDRSTDRSTGLLTVGCVHVCTFSGRPGGRPDPIFSRPTFGRLKVSDSLFVAVDRAVDRGPATALFLKTRSTGRSTEAVFQP